MQRGIEEGRIRAYCKAFYEHQLAVHFKNEEETLFPLLGSTNEMTQTAVLQHKRIRKYIYEDALGQKGLSRLEELLDKHIRFEERKVFPAIQQLIGEKTMNSLHFPDDDHAREFIWEDAFWL